MVGLILEEYFYALQELKLCLQTLVTTDKHLCKGCILLYHLPMSSSSIHGAGELPFQEFICSAYKLLCFYSSHCGNAVHHLRYFAASEIEKEMQGGVVALYSQLCRSAKFCLLPNHQASDDELSTYYKPGSSNGSIPSSPLKRFIEKHKNTKMALLIFVLLGACMAICVGALIPAISAKFPLAGFRVKTKKKKRDGRKWKQ
ncbi:hypothetical protein VNO80_11681 [Phaseolus coccineus]|uniref:Uncharacterized protein n=1 Tax=Phaseolus coccineus TaxID=3886 RepID=A0AAN9NFR7_PHACN